MILGPPRRRDALKNVHDERNAFFSRSLFAVLLLVAGVGLLVARLVDLQLRQHGYFSTRADENRMRVVPVAPVRGLIYDRNGVVLAQNQPAFVLEITPEQVADMPQTLQRLAAIIDIGETDLERFHDRVGKTPRYRGVPLRSNLSMEEVARYEIRRHEFPGVEVTAGLSRNYPLAASGAHIVGYVGGITEQELQQVDEAAYRGINQIGKVGVEKSREDLLRGEPGAKIIEANAFGRPLRELDYRRGYPGRNLILSLDARVQLVAERALGPLTGAIVAIDPASGEVIALVSKPGYDPHYFIEGISSADYKALLDNPQRPLYNRALQGTYPPGSTVKPAMALAGLEYGAAEPAHREFCGGQMSLPGSTRKYRCWKRSGHGWVDMAMGVMRSCDIYFYQLALNLGIDRIHAAMTGFGLGAPTGLDVPLEKGGLFPSREWKQVARRESWYPGETLNVGIGQGFTLTTPVQLAQMTARIAMRGGGYRPHVLRSYEDPITRERVAIEPEPLQRIELKDNRHWATVISAMEEVTHSPSGTAYRIGQGAPYRIASKTGTAQVASLRQDELRAPTLAETPVHLRDHALFIAFAPVEEPRIAIAVIAEHAGGGSAVAAPIARMVMDQYLLGEVQFTGAPAIVPPPPERPAPRTTPRPTP
ncbi:penicillin-binding protein 2 [Sinimarinibacterium flocculans]|uniref:penicillin-binding protein 2 n=1 Tax=Sinimarinibacterium flocculans TaxID=985250 RepID=UPI003513FB0D